MVDGVGVSGDSGGIDEDTRSWSDGSVDRDSGWRWDGPASNGAMVEYAESVE